MNDAIATLEVYHICAHLYLFVNLLQVMFTYQAVSDVELSLSIGDYVVVRKVCNCLNVFLILNTLILLIGIRGAPGLGFRLTQNLI